MGFVVKEERVGGGGGGKGKQRKTQSTGNRRRVEEVRRGCENRKLGARSLACSLARLLPPHGRIDRFKGILEGPDFLV